MVENVLANVHEIWTTKVLLKKLEPNISSKEDLELITSEEAILRFVNS